MLLAMAAIAVVMVSPILEVVFHKPDLIVQNNTQDILPGGNRAMLTLANGEVIDLANAKQGNVAVKQGSSILKRRTGLLVYEDKGWPEGNRQTGENTLTTPAGGIWQLRLADGTRVWLNNSSSLTYPSSFRGESQRRVTLNGEAYFEVAKDKRHPFVVSGGGQEVSVVGTHLDINAFPDERAVSTTLLEGMVIVSAANKKLMQKGPHLRLRVRMEPAMVKDVQYELQSLIGEVQVSGLVQKAYFDTYRCEIERYSANLIEDVEEVFYRGSELVARRLAETFAGEEAVLSLWPIVHCYRIITTFFEGDWQQTTHLCERSARAFFEEHGGGKNLKRSMADRYRSMQNALSQEILINGTEAMESQTLGLALKTLSDAAVENGFNRQKLIADIVHMQVNRIFTPAQRRHEAFIWHCLLKLAVTGFRRHAQLEAAVIGVR